MKPKNTLRLLGGSIATLLFTHSVQASTLYWDLNQTTDNVAVAITGNWDGTTVNWNDDATGGAGGLTTAGTTNADDLVFSSGSLFTTGTVTLIGAQAANSITLDDNISVTLAGTLIQNNAAVTADNTTDIFTYTGTAVADGQVVYFGGTAPTGLNAGQLYYIVNATATTYQVSSTAGGAAIDFTSNGTSVTHTVKAPLNLGGGLNAGISVLSGDNQPNIVSVPVVLAGNSTFQTAGNGNLNISGGIDGTGNLSLVSNGLGSSISFNTASVNNVGTLSFSGTSYARNSINVGIGSNVTSITQESNNANLMIAGTGTYAVAVNSGGTTVANNGLQSLTFFRDNTNYAVFTGTGNVVFNNNSAFSVPHGIDLNGAKGKLTVAHVGSITNSGTGLGGTRIDANITTSVTDLIQNSATSNLYLVNALSTPGAGAVTQDNNAYTGPVSINAGILYSGYSNALTNAATAGGSKINFGGGTLMYGVASATDLSLKFSNTGTSPYSIDTNGQSVTYGPTSDLAANGTKGLNKFGPGTLTLQGANTYTGTTTIGGGTGTLERLAGGTLTVTGSLNGTTGTALTFGGSGIFNASEASGVSQGMGALTFSAGDGTVQSTNNGGNSFLTFSSLAAPAVGSTANFEVINGTNGTDNKIDLTSTTNAPLAGGTSNPGMFFGGTDYARYDAGGYFRAVTYGTDTNAAASVGAGATLGTSDADKDVKITGAISAQTTASYNTLNFGAAVDVALTGGATLSLNGILRGGTNSSVISGGTGISPTASNGDLVIRTDVAGSNLTINSPILANGTNALTKSGLGTLKISGTYGLAGNTYINQGTLLLDTPADRTYGGVITGAGGLAITGPGTLTLTTAATFTGGLSIDNGTLKLDFSDPGAPSAEMLNGVNLLTLGSNTATGLLNVVQGGGTLLIKAKSSGITTQNLSMNLPGTTSGGIITNAGSNRILVDPNGGSETQVLMGQLQNVIMRNGNGERVATNGSTLLIGKPAGAGAGNVRFMYATDGRNGQGFSGNFPARLVYSPDGGTTVDFMRYTGDNNSSPYIIVPITDPASGFSYSTLITNQNGGGYVRLTNADGSVTGVQGGFTGIKLDNPVNNGSITVAGTITPAGGIIMTGSTDFSILDGIMSSDNNANARAYVFQQWSTGTLTISSVLNQTTNGQVVKSGTGRLVFSGPNTYTGTTYINEGTLTAGSAETVNTSGPFGKQLAAAAGTIIFAGGTLQYSAANSNDYSGRFATTAGQPIRIDTNGEAVTFATALTSPGGTLTVNDTAVTKGTLTLTNTNTYTGTTTVSAGTLAIGTGGSLANTTVSVGSSGTLGGIGTIAGSTTIDGNHAPGLSAGIQTFSNSLAYLASSNLKWELNDDVSVATTGVRGQDFDGVNVTGGAFSITSGATIDLSFGGAVDFLDAFWDVNRSWQVVDLSGSVTGDGGSELFILGTFTGATPSGGSFNVSRVSDGTWNDVFLNWVASAGGASYATWAAAFSGPVLSNQDADADPDFDGLSNALEYVIGSDPRTPNQGGPSGGVVGTNLVLNLTRVDSSETADVGLKVQVSTDLQDWTTIASYTIGADTGSSTAGVVIDEGTPTTDPDEITITIPKGVDVKKFARVTVTITP